MGKNNKDLSGNSINLKNVWGVASVWFAAHVGGGFATGNQTMAFFVRNGWYTLWIPILVVGIIALVYREVMIMAKNNQVYNYKDLTQILYAPYHKVFSLVFEICYLIIVLLATGGSIAGAASLFVEFGFDYNIGAILTGIALFALTIFGAELIRSVSSLMTIVIVICLSAICYIGIVANYDNLDKLLTTQYVTTSVWSALWSGLKYAGFQSVVWSILISVCQPLKNDREVNATAVVGFIINTAMILLSCIMLFAWIPETSGETLPILYICRQIGKDWLVIMYMIILLLAFISTGIGCVFGAIARFENTLKIPQNITLKRGIISLGCMIFSVGISLFGLTNIVKIGYGYTGIISIFVVIIPTLTVGHMKNKNFKKAKEIEKINQ